MVLAEEDMARRLTTTLLFVSYHVKIQTFVTTTCFTYSNHSGYCSMLRGEMAGQDICKCQPCGGPAPLVVRRCYGVESSSRAQFLSRSCTVHVTLHTNQLRRGRPVGLLTAKNRS